MTETITYFTPEGEPREYRTVSQRLPEFLKAFPLRDGYQIIRGHEAYTQFNPDLLALHKACIEAGRKPVDMGLGDPTNQKVVFYAKLVKDGVVILNASALKPINKLKDWESGETAAFQRLMAAAGFGGEVLDEDDRYDRVSCELERPGPGESDQSTAQESFHDHDRVASQTETTSQPQEPAREEPVQEPATEAVDHDSSSSVTPAALEQSGVRPQFLNQLRQVAALVGEEVPEVSTNEQAKAELKRLNDLARKAS